MAIRVAPGAHEVIGDNADGFVLHVTGASDQDAALEALALVRPDVLALARSRPGGPGPAVSVPVMAPGGPLMRVAQLGAGEEELQRVPDLLVTRLAEAGVVDAVIGSPEQGGPLDALDSCPNAVVLRLFPSPAGEAGTLPAAWMDIACEWVLGDLAPTDTVPLRLLAVPFEVPVADAPAVLHQASLARAWCDAVNGSLDERIRTASVTFGGTPHLALAAGGPACDSTALLARFDLLVEVARELAPHVTYACLDIEATFEGIGLGLGGAGWRAHGGASPNRVAGHLVDELVPDAFPYQVLGPGHVQRFVPGADLAAPPLGEPLGGQRIELFVAEPAEWLPIDEGREDALAQGLDLLAPLLATDDQVDELLALREGAHRGADRRAASASWPGDGNHGVPDLDDIVLETLPHSRRGLRLTLLELVAWLAHEPHNDAPVSVSPVLATYARWFASALDDERRQELKSRARLLIGTGHSPATAPGRRRRLAPADGERAWLATDWLIRVQAPSWLRAAGLVEAAGRLEATGPTTSRHELVRAVDVLSQAIVIGSRRIDLTASVAGAERSADAALVDQAAWVAWERASEAAGWVAASEAAAVGVPADLAYATDLRVIECARDPHQREELEALHRSVGDAAWAAALHAVADAAWAAGQRAAGPAVDAAAVVPLATALDRATRAAVSRLGLDEDGAEIALEQADGAAKARLTRAALGSPVWNAHDHPWDGAREAAAGSEGGGLWSLIQELAAAAVEEGPWKAGMTAARAAVDEVLRDAPDLVARAVGAAVAREAAGVAARGTALRAAAMARSQGADEEEVTEAAQAELRATAAELQEAAFALLDVLIGVGPRDAPGDGDPGAVLAASPPPPSAPSASAPSPSAPSASAPSPSAPASAPSAEPL